ncbi:AbrB/MazE/SpoVT family DNA-binding domain-containing protein [Yersinia enterocolitica]|nr:AbrB/MazE/SpoVT family DNA-binding domain-containing protein [Yersinia enterocolitica]
MVQVTIKIWGNSPSVRLPVAVMETVGLKIDDAVEIVAENGYIAIVPIRPKEVSLQYLKS